MVKVGIRNFVVIGILAILFIVIAKVAFNKFQVKGVSDVVNAV
jgi:hypothetical protein